LNHAPKAQFPRYIDLNRFSFPHPFLVIDASALEP